MHATILQRMLPICFVSEPFFHRLLIPNLSARGHWPDTRNRRIHCLSELPKRTIHSVTTSTTTGFTPCEKFRGVFAGSGSDGLNEAAICSAILEMTEKEPSKVVVMYVGTATYDLPGPMQRQTARFKEAGCTVQTLNVTERTPTLEEMERAVAGADIVIVSGGNTLFAIDRWVKIGLHSLLRAGMERGLVLSGGSAGAICWFDGGHSDSMDPDTYKAAMTAPKQPAQEGDESSTAPSVSQPPKAWEYIRIDGMGFLPGLLCPHHDKVRPNPEAGDAAYVQTQSNGVLRADDFDAMLLRHRGERGLGIDHWAALAVRGQEYRVLSLAGKEGSVLPDGGFSPARAGAPGVWVKEAMEDSAAPGGARVERRLAPAAGRVSELLRAATRIEGDPRVAVCRAQNPS